MMAARAENLNETSSGLYYTRRAASKRNGVLPLDRWHTCARSPCDCHVARIAPPHAARIGSQPRDPG